MVNEIIISAPLFEYPVERLIAIIIGLGMFIHFHMMANFAHEKSPWCIAIVMGCVGGSAVGLIVSGLIGNINYIYQFGMGSAASILALWLLLWYKGLHVKDFLDREYGHEKVEQQ